MALLAPRWPVEALLQSYRLPGKESNFKSAEIILHPASAGSNPFPAGSGEYPRSRKRYSTNHWPIQGSDAQRVPGTATFLKGKWAYAGSDRTSVESSNSWSMEK